MSDRCITCTGTGRRWVGISTSRRVTCRDCNGTGRIPLPRPEVYGDKSPGTAFWSIPTFHAVNVAHYYPDRRHAACGATHGPGKESWDHEPTSLACRKCRTLRLKEHGQWCKRCQGKGRLTIQKSPTRKTIKCDRCDGLGLVPIPQEVTTAPPPPPRPNLRPSYPLFEFPPE